jgi:hypothetical protein
LLHLQNAFFHAAFVANRGFIFIRLHGLAFKKSGTPSAKDGKMNEHENSHFNCGCNRNGFDLRHIAAVAVSATADTGNQQAAAAVAPAANIGNQQAATAVSATANTGDKCAAAAITAAADARNKFGATVLSGQNKPFACLGCPVPAVLVLVH